MEPTLSQFAQNNTIEASISRSGEDNNHKRRGAFCFLIKAFPKKCPNTEDGDTSISLIQRCEMLIHERNWLDAFKTIRILKQMNVSGAMCSVKCSRKCKNQHSLVHFACRKRPPLFIIKELLKGFPDAVHEKDCMGRFPLHIVVMYGSYADVVEYLLQKHNVAGTSDIQGRTPLHLLFNDLKYRSKDGIEFGPETRDSIYPIVSLLCEASLRCAVTEDHMGKSALEYAIEEEADFAIVKVLQKMSRTFYRHGPNISNEKIENETQNEAETSLPRVWKGLGKQNTPKLKRVVNRAA